MKSNIGIKVIRELNQTFNRFQGITLTVEEYNKIIELLEDAKRHILYPATMPYRTENE